MAILTCQPCHPANSAPHDARRTGNMVTVSMPIAAWEAIISAAKAHYETVLYEDGQPEERDEVLALGAALDDVDQQPLPEPSR